LGNSGYSFLSGLIAWYANLLNLPSSTIKNKKANTIMGQENSLLHDLKSLQKIFLTSEAATMVIDKSSRIILVKDPESQGLK